MLKLRKEILLVFFIQIVLSIQEISERSRDDITALTRTKTQTTTSKKYELSSSGGKIFHLQPNVLLDLMLRRTEASWSYVIFHAHSKYQVTSVSSSTIFNYSTTNSGPDGSILKKLPYMEQGQYIRFYIKSNYSETYDADVISTPYSNGAPFPGGCCLTCSMEIDPNLYISYNVSNLKTTILFSHANVYYRRDQKEVPCDSNRQHPHKDPEHYRLEYSLYQAFLEEGNLDQDVLFKGLEMMSSPSTIKSYGTKIASLKAPKVPRVYLDTVAGQGIIFNIIVNDPVRNAEAAYTPVHTYGCSFTSKIANCDSVVSTINKVFAVVGAVAALFMCFLGHRFFKLALFLGGLMNGGFICYIILSESTSISHTGLMLSSAALGIVCGVLVFLLWWFTEYVRLCLYINALFLGFLGAGCLLFSPAGDMDAWKNDIDYGLLVIAISVVLPFIMLPWPKVLSIVYTSVVSGYGFIIGIDAFIHTSMSYLLLNIVIRAIETDYSNVIVIRPFQWKDTILCLTWGVLAVLGMIVQYTLSRKRMDFPRSGYLEQKRARRYYDRSVATERTPILINTQGYNTNDTNEICWSGLQRTVK